MKEETKIGTAAERLYMEKQQNHPWPWLRTSDFIQMEGIQGGAGDPEGKQPKVPDALSSLVKVFYEDGTTTYETVEEVTQNRLGLFLSLQGG